MKRTAIVAVVTLAAAGSAVGATRYVAKSDGCTHMAGLACSSSSHCGTTFANACCSVQQCIDSSKTGKGDTCEVHAGTYTDSSNVRLDGKYNSYAVDVDKAGLTIKEAPGETATLDGGSDVHGCAVIRSDGVTLDGIDCHDYVCGVEANRVGEILIWGASRVAVRNVTITSALPVGQGEYACAAVRIQGKGADDVLIENNRLKGHMGHSVMVEGTSGSSGIVVRNNTIEETANAGTDASRIFCVKSTATNAPIVFYDNRITTAVGSKEDGPMLYVREPQAESRIYLFNNVCAGCANGVYGAINTQDNVRPYSVQNVTFFNNTVTGRGQLVSWQMYFSALKVINNLCDGCRYLIRGYPSATSDGVSHGAARDQLWSAATDKLTYNVVENSSESPYHPDSEPSPQGSVDVTGTKQTTEALSQRDSDNNLTAGLAVATNDPLGQGPGVCSITAAGQTIDCSVDINGTKRGTSWDAGAVQYARPGR